MEYFGVNTIYHSFQAHYEHRFNQGLSVTLAYTFSHLIDNAADTINEGGCVCQTPNLTNNRDSSSHGSAPALRGRICLGNSVW